MTARSASRSSECIVAVLAKAPHPGAVKSRLAARIGASAAAALHARLVRRTLSTAAQAAIGPVELWCAPSAEEAFFQEMDREFGANRFTQSTGDLGERMSQAVAQALGRASCVVLIGTDCPDLTPADLREASAALAAGADVVLGPAEDGGYHLIGLRCNEPRVFEGIAWSTDGVLAQTRERLAALGLHWHELPERWDLDRPEDYDRLLADPELASLAANLTLPHLPS
jgi:rSAM/selenodomain-associated transferase 1